MEEIARSRGHFLWRNKEFVIYVAAAFLYLVSPLDAIPEAIFGIIGLIDDIAVISLVVLGIANKFLGVLEARNFL